jgi:transposase
MSKRPRRNHAPAFKAKVTLDTLKDEQTLVELSVHDYAMVFGEPDA